MNAELFCCQRQEKKQIKCFDLSASVHDLFWEVLRVVPKRGHLYFADRGTRMARAVATDPLSAFRFQVEASDDIAAIIGTGGRVIGAGFTSCTVPEITVETVEYREGQTTWTAKLPGIPSTDTITLRKGLVSKDTSFWDWLSQVIYGTGRFRTTIEIKHYSRNALPYSPSQNNFPPFTDLSLQVNGVGAPVPARVYRMREAFPVRCKLASDLDATDTSISISELEIAYEYIEVDVNE